MSIQPLSRIAIAAACTAILVAATTAASAAGKHGGGHGHGHKSQYSYDFGMPGKPADVARTIQIIATDNRFDLPEISVEAGETVRFVIFNRGDFLHEFNLGPPEMHAKHQAEMLKMMERGELTSTEMAHGDKHHARHGKRHGRGMMHHDHDNAVLIPPGEQREMIWKFKHSHNLEFACNLPGHYESGMVGKLKFRHRKGKS